MIVSINQPAYLPWPGYFDRIVKSDLFISLDHVQFEKNSLINRNKIKTPQGWVWLTVPVKTKGKFGNLSLTSLETNQDIKWSNKHFQAILSSYGKARFFGDYREYFQEIYSKEWPLLNDLITETNNFLLKELTIKTETIKSSDFNPQESKSDLVLELCQKVGAKTYLSGPFGRDYLDLDSFDKAGIEVIYHDYIAPEYSQLYNDFEPYMSVIDMLFNCGPQSHQLLQNSPESLKRA